MWRIRFFFDSVRNLIRWFPLIWKDRDWDQSYIYILLQAKIRHMRERNEKIKFYVGHENDAKWMRVCERLLDILINSKYWEDEYDDKPLNIRNMPELNDFYRSMYNANKSGFPQEIREMKAKRLLFRILNNNIDYWWD